MRRRHRATHRGLWTVLAVLLPMIVILALAARRTGPLEAPQVQLTAPSPQASPLPSPLPSPFGAPPK